ncbi:hypothetical protein [Catenulispora subtropica]|uniref:hypothetical protein n=1 Tax=Catenulispora subtropica TaxID=450798 RepID=UPI0031E1CAE8
MSERAAPAYCPYCGDEDLRPEEGGHRRWSCRGCRRVFEVSFVGLLAPGGPPSGSDIRGED